ncbi:MAG: nitrogenase component 1 [Pseudomonadota bacterium]
MQVSSPPRTGRGAAFYVSPWINPDSACVGGIQHQPPEMRDAFKALETDLTGADVSGGSGAGKLARLLKELACFTGKKDLVLLNLTCLPAKMGDPAKVGRLLAKHGIKAQVLYNDPDVDQAVPPIIQKVRNEIARGAAKRIRKKPGAYNLVGFPRCREKNELVSFLSDIGMRLNVELIPDIDFEDLGRLKAGQVTLLFPEIHFNGLYQAMFKGVDLNAISPPAPFGMEGSRMWLRSAARAAGLERKFDAAWKHWMKGAEKTWSALKAEARGHSIGFVGTAGELKRFASPLRAAGVPIFQVLGEAGFGVELFVFRRPLEQESAAGALTDFIASSFPILRGRVRETGFGSPGRLKSALQGSGSSAIYSDIFYDTRITRNSKTPLSIAFFRMGPKGALGTAEDILGACGLGFYKQYGRYLE